MHPMGKSKKKIQDNTIAQNKRARFDYHLLESYEAGLSLAGWEVKSMRAGRVQLTDSYVLMKNGEFQARGAGHFSWNRLALPNPPEARANAWLREWPEAAK